MQSTKRRLYIMKSSYCIM